MTLIEYTEKVSELAVMLTMGAISEDEHARRLLILMEAFGKTRQK